MHQLNGCFLKIYFLRQLMDATAMIGKNKGIVALFKNHIMDFEHTGNLIILHRSLMCEDNILLNVMNITIKVVNMILPNKLYHM